MDQNEFKEHIHYNQQSGAFTWIKPTNKCIKKGAKFGYLHHKYMEGRLNGYTSGLHRFAFLYMEGKFPSHVDHINHIKNDNRWCNLRSVTHRENMMNKPLHKNNTSGINGVCFHKASNKWNVQITIDRKRKNLGVFDKFENAVKVRKHAEFISGYHANHGKGVA